MSSQDGHAVGFTLLDTLGAPMSTGPFRISASVSDTSLAEISSTTAFDRFSLLGRGVGGVRVEGEATVTLQVNTRRFDFPLVGRTARDDSFASTDTVWVDSTAVPGIRYDYRVHACGIFGCTTFPSPVVSGVAGG